ncbi:MAG: hypothetical protein K6T85_12820 [Gorillibacterium sp.]|nr:hypothetical protein [Gorillibacterium sp.]
MNRVKKKWMAGILAVSMFGGASVALGGTDIGIQLRTWVNERFSISKGQADTDLQQYYSQEYNRMLPVLNEYTPGAKRMLEEQGTLRLQAVFDALNARKQDYLTQINTEKQTLMNDIPNLFKTYNQEMVNQFNDKINNFANQYYNDMVNAANATADSTKGNMETRINQEGEQAKQAVQQAIASAKGELQAKINAEKEAAVNAVKAEITAKINGSTSELERKRQEYVNGKKNEITQKGDQLQQSALQNIEQALNTISQ